MSVFGRELGDIHPLFTAHRELYSSFVVPRCLQWVIVVRPAGTLSGRTSAVSLGSSGRRLPGRLVRRSLGEVGSLARRLVPACRSAEAMRSFPVKPTGTEACGYAKPYP